MLILQKLGGLATPPIPPLATALLRKAILSAFYNILQRNFGLIDITNFVMLFQAVMNFCLDLFRSKFSLLRKWSSPTYYL